MTNGYTSAMHLVFKVAGTGDGCGVAQKTSRKPMRLQRDCSYANLVWIMSGFSCHSSFSTHICNYVSVASAHGRKGGHLPS